MGGGGGHNSPARSPNTETYKGIDTHRWADDVMNVGEDEDDDDEVEGGSIS